MAVWIEAKLKFDPKNKQKIIDYLSIRGASRISFNEETNYITWDQYEGIYYNSDEFEQGEYLFNLFKDLCKEKLIEKSEVIKMFKNDELYLSEVQYENMECDYVFSDEISKKFNDLFNYKKDVISALKSLGYKKDVIDKSISEIPNEDFIIDSEDEEQLSDLISKVIKDISSKNTQNIQEEISQLKYQFKLYDEGKIDEEPLIPKKL